MRSRGFLSIVRAELGRALAALRRYEMLRAGQAHREKLPPADIPRRIFEEFYASPADPEQTGRERRQEGVLNRARRPRAGFER